MFSIGVEGVEDGLAGEVVGRIVVGEFSERFRVPVGYWSVVDYRRSWYQSFQKLSSADESLACLMTGMTDPERSNFLTCWPLYRAGDVVHVQNHLVFLDELDAPFDPEQPWLSVLPRPSVDEDGYRISEWEVPFGAVKEFFDGA